MNDKPKILVIDDDRVIRLACAKTLQHDGINVDEAESGKIGLEKLESESYHLVLLDLMMPEMSGSEVLEHIQKIDKNIVVIIITGFATIESAVETLQKGAYDYISKPFTPDELRKIVQKGLERSRLLREAVRLRQEREENLKAIAAEKSRLSTIINCMGEGLIATDQNANLILINSLACQLLEIEEPFEIGRDIRGFLNNEELESWILDTLNKKQFPQKFINKEIIFDEEAGKIYSVTLAPIIENGNKISGLALVIMDVSEEKKLEKRKAEFRKLVSIVAHELKAPINAIEGYLDIIIKGYVKDNPDKLIEYLTRSRDKAEMLRSLVQDLLSLTSLETGKLTKQMLPLDIKPVLQEIAGFFENEAKIKNVTINHNLLEEFPLIIGDRNALNYLFTNLVSNAIKYNVENGSVTLNVHVKENHLVVSVSDTGIGISEEDLPKIFNEFYRSKNDAIQKISGTGLGLNITRKIAELHNGFIKVTSTVNKGSRFDVYLPILKMH